ncbi:efflux RND transporter periplasmic adaptor subunit [Patescibacteria group bacterium]|nr:efflux RND transporter periplasmic adaptor subunit [Patescibacteria group bacterium]MBU1016400.1 efflux RND transporter periplasmic adaptor subunit [Patescibacteria group bacterium]MBU1685148.1 efflux RND transporter periplasmic adaptor subunit [Patescibacteria group bacterium]MBU1938805.1 efflux RND transporter periplasmic adaptor subunit [Patescibacteria group bacterium]
MPKKTPFYKRKLYIIPTILILIAAGWVTFSMTREKVVDIQTMKAVKKDLIQEVSVTGSVEPSESVNLSFEISGKVNEIFADVGDRVIAGQKLISLSSADLQAQLNQAYAGVTGANALVQQYQAALDVQKAKLEEIKKGTRPEEIQLSQTALENARKSLTDAQSNLNNVDAKNEADLTGVYEAARTALPTAADAGKSALLTLSDIQSVYFTESYQDKYSIETAKATAVYELLGTANAGGWIRQYISTLNGGVYGKVQNLSLSASGQEIENALKESISALQKVKNALNTIPITSNISSTDLTKLDTEKTSVGTQIDTLTGHEQSISLQKAANQNLITTAENAVNTAKNNLASAADELRLKQAGSTNEQIKAQEAMVRQAEAYLASQRAQVSSQQAVVQNYKAQLDKTVLYAPITGLVTKMEAKVGEVVFPSSPYSTSRVTFVSIISDKNYKIETYVAEIDIAKIEIGDPSKVTLDAYGDEKEFEARVTGVDPAETIIEGIPTYKVTLEFTREDERIKSGMTANLDIMTNKREMVITVPQRAVISKNGKKYLKILKNEYLIEEVEVQTGLRGSDGTIEILEGINEGDEVVLSIEE